jgi:hypothetical protein
MASLSRVAHSGTTDPRERRVDCEIVTAHRLLLRSSMRFLFVPGAIAAWCLCACGSDKNTSSSPDANSTGDSSLQGGDDAAIDSGSLADSNSGTADAEGGTGEVPEAGDAGEAGHSCAPIIQADAGTGACPSSGQALLYPCGLPASVGDLDAGASGDGGWTLDGGHTFACMTLCNDITGCYVTPGSAPAVVVTCCP